MTTVPLSYRNGRADELRAWSVTRTLRTPRNRIISRFSLEVVAVRVGRGVAWYQLGTRQRENRPDDPAARSLARALGKSLAVAPTFESHSSITGASEVCWAKTLSTPMSGTSLWSASAVSGQRRVFDASPGLHQR